MNEAISLIHDLREAEKKIFSCGCPYLALSDQMGYITAEAVRTNPQIGLSNFGRLSVTKILQTNGYTTNYAHFIYRFIEKGMPLDKIAMKILVNEIKLGRVEDEFLGKDGKMLYEAVMEQFNGTNNVNERCDCEECD